jgi:L-alanine-DL-glutamate epimerase-like enolase superfamily enzyme
MKIKSIRAQVARIPLDEPLAGGPAYFRSHNQFVLVRVDTDDIQGIGVSFMGGVLSASLKQAIEQLGELIVGEDPLRIEALLQKLRTAGASAGPGGILTLAVAGIDMALWDIKGKFFGQSLAAMLGGLRDRVPSYASGALVRAYPIDHLVKAARTLVEKGFKAMKTQLALPGDTTPGREAEHARRIREAVGPDIDLM